MRVTVRTFASLRELSADRFELELADVATLEDVWTAVQARFPRVEPHRSYVRAVIRIGLDRDSGQVGDARAGDRAGHDERQADVEQAGRRLERGRR